MRVSAGEDLLCRVSPFELDVSSNGPQLFLLVLAVKISKLYFVNGTLFKGIWWNTIKNAFFNILEPLHFVEGLKVAAVRVNC